MLDSDHYIEMLQNGLILEAGALFLEEWTSQQNSAMFNSSARTREFMQGCGIHVLHLPAKSWHLNIMSSIPKWVSIQQC